MPIKASIRSNMANEDPPMDDPVIPFRLSHALLLAETKRRLDDAVAVLRFVGYSSVSLLAAILTVLLMRGGG